MIILHVLWRDDGLVLWGEAPRGTLAEEGPPGVTKPERGRALPPVIPSKPERPWGRGGATSSRGWDRRMRQKSP